MGTCHVQQIENLDIIALFHQEISAVPQDIGFGICHNKRGVALDQVGLDIAVGFARAGAADDSGVQIAQVNMGI